MEKKYWKSLHEVQPAGHLQTDDLRAEDQARSMMEILADDKNPQSSSRRDFLKWCGISFVSATVLSACENPVKKAIPYLNQPEELIPGKASYYASTYLHGNEYCPVLVKSRDGRPIKIEGNRLSPVTRGGTSARVQASVLSLYDTGARYKNALHNGEAIAWEAADEAFGIKLREVSANGGRMALVTPSLLSPSTRALIEEFKTEYPGLEVVAWDAIPYSGIRKAHETLFGQAIIPDYRFDKADLIVSFGCDFLGTWLSPIEFAGRYAERRRVSQDKPEMSRHIQFEGMLSLTGANADERVPVKPSEELNILLALYNRMAALAGQSPAGEAYTNYDVNGLAAHLMKQRGKALVVCGSPQAEVQTIVAAINQLCGAYGNTIDPTATLMTGMSDEGAFEALVNDMKQGKMEAVMFYQTNPVYHHYDTEGVLNAIKNTGLTLSFATTMDETAEACQYILPDNHYLESWGDAEFKSGQYSLMQPLIHPLFKTRQFQDTLLTWMGREADFHQYLKAWWQTNLFPQQTEYSDAESFWMKTLQSGVLEVPAKVSGSFSPNFSGLTGIIANLQGQTRGSDLEFVVYPSLSMGDGHDANNPWLQELPDPITSVCWDNFAAVSPATATQLGFLEGDVIRINEKMEVPVLIQPGLAAGMLAIALGYGRSKAGISADGRGGNAFLLSADRNFHGTLSSWSKAGTGHTFARTQTHFSMEGRAIVRESTLDKYKENPAAGNELRAYHLKHHNTLYPESEFPGHHWALMVDLNACTGCSTCVIACQSENNTPVIGKDQVRRRRIMHWMRIDRYYTGDAENPSVVFQPLMCQHCDHAPCENVCPVAATTHSQEGINQITYNRCVGTKYCINNCPYKVRRFNWYEYATKEQFNTHTTTDLGRMVLNPDVTVRERGVVEKCSFCVQRIQEAKLNAKNERRPLKDGEIMPACVQSCPSNALVFGDLNDPESRVSQLIKDPRNYHLLEELHTLPSVGYLTKIRNPRS
ncbi:MAG: 4Fe-4S dicluster domain-containing protein [Bacteroides sp.]|jgi:molybdopterin-containing oxidoreductase family iron-sulfur binding subunit|nr:4Fe-4S dicluster domain-containing protein [Bacteroides sp.]